MEYTLPPQYAMHLEAYSHGFRVSRFNDNVRRLLVEFCRRYVKTETSVDRSGRYLTEVKKVFAAATAMRNQYFFHRNVLEEFYEHMQRGGYLASQILKSERPMYEPARVRLEWIRHDITFHDYQNDIMDFCALEEPRTKLICLQAGQGKTLAAIGYMNRAQVRTVLVMRRMYMDQWKREILKSFKLGKGDFYVVEGSKALKDLITLAKEDPAFDPGIILISNATYRNYLRSFFDNPATFEYGCLPWEFFELMRAGLVAVDEVHQDFHFNFITHCLSNMYKYAAMSATMVSDDSTMNRYYRIMFPADTYAPRPALKKYIDLYDVYYRFDRPDLIRFTQRGAYHQATFEQSIMRRKTVLKNYTAMIVQMVEHQFFKHHSYREGMKALVFCDTVTMCEQVRDAIAAKFPQRNVKRFCATVDPESNLYDPDVDVVVTTLKSCGTARDVAKVTVCICSVAITGRQASEQLIHRLRELKGEWASIAPRFVFLSNRDNAKHLKYSEDRRSKLAHVVKNFNTLTASFVL
jgi:hypothetical protein